MLSKISNITRMCDCHRSVCIMRSQSKFQFKTKICLIFLTLLEKTSRGAYSDVKTMLTAISAEAYNTFYTLRNLGRQWCETEVSPILLCCERGRCFRRGPRLQSAPHSWWGTSRGGRGSGLCAPERVEYFSPVCVCDSPEQLISSFSLLRTQ